MSDPVTNIEIEDVLSSIRKLVSENARSTRDDSADRAAAEKLVLTPSLRVEEVAEPDPVQAAETVDDVSDVLTLENAEIPDEPAPHCDEADVVELTFNGEAEAVTDPQPVDEQEGAFFAEAGSDAEEEISFEADQPSDVYDVNPEDTAQNSLQSRMAQVTSVLTGRNQDGSVNNDLSFEEEEQDEMQAPDTFGDNNFAPEESLPKDDWEDVSFSAKVEGTGYDNTVPFAVPSPDADTAESGTDEDEQDLDVDFPTATTLEDALLDEEMLRDLVSELVREELQGALGERITRNVRKLVRREIHRALSSLELE